MNILGIEGSPRENGNTEKLVRAILEGAEKQGAAGKFRKLAAMEIAPCRGCRSCKKQGACIVDDDMKILYDEIQAADAVVIGSPVYMWQVTAQTKAFMDRLMAFIAPDFSTRLNGPKRLAMAYTQGNPDEEAFSVYFDYLDKLFAFLHYDVRGRILACQTREKADILAQSEVLNQAGRLGQKLVTT